MGLFENILENSAKVADKVAKVTGEYIDKGKDKLNELSLENELSKAQKQLGALVYALHKTGTSDDELVAMYIEDIAKIESQLEALRAENAEDAQYAKYCTNCGATVDTEDVYCKNCGVSVK